MSHKRYAFLEAAYGGPVFAGLAQDQTRPEWTGLALSKAFKKFASYDPTSEKEHYRYLQWMCRRYLESLQPGHNSLKAEDFYKLHSDLALFDRRKHKLPEEQRDINSYTRETLQDLCVELSEQDYVSAKELKRQAKAEIYEQTEIYYDGPEGMILSPQTMEAAQFWGQGTRWCTSARDPNENAFEGYHAKGPLITYIPAGEGEERAEKFQGHEDSSLHNSQDDGVAEVPEKLKALVAAALKNYHSPPRSGPQGTWVEHAYPFARMLVQQGSLSIDGLPDEYSKDDIFWQEMIRSSQFWKQLQKRRDYGVGMETRNADFDDDGRHVPAFYWRRKDFCLQALKHIEEDFSKKIPPTFFEDMEFFDAVLELRDVYFIDHVPKETLTEEMLLKIIEGEGGYLFEFGRMPLSVLTEPGFIDKIHEVISFRQYVSDYIREHKDGLIALLPDKNWTQYMDESFWLNEDFIFSMLHKKVVPENVFENARFWNVLAAWPEDVPETYWQDKEFCLCTLAHSKNIEVFGDFIPESMWQDPAFCRRAVEAQPEAIHCVPEDILWDDRQSYQALARKHPSLLDYIP